MEFTIDDLIWWLRNGNNGNPFVVPEDILKADPQLEVNFWFKDEDHPVGDVNVLDPSNGNFVITDLDENNEIIWENWREIKSI